MADASARRGSDYRWLGIVATVVGLIVLLVGLVLPSADVAITGGLLTIVHGILSLVIYAGGPKPPKSPDHA